MTSAAKNHFALIHLSDPHLPVDLKWKWAFLLNKRIVGFVNWKKRREIHRNDALNRVIRDALATPHDQIVVTGDLTNLGTDEELIAARNWLKRLGHTRRVSVIPGNHDAYVSGACEAFCNTLHDWIPQNHLLKPSDPNAIWPSLRLCGDFALIGLSSAVPCPPFFATGRIGNEQLKRFANLLDKLKQKAIARIVLLHHPPIKTPAHHARRLIDTQDFLDVLRHKGAEAVLSGHEHRIDCLYLKGPGYTLPLVLAGSASDSRQDHKPRGGYTLVHFTRENNRLRIDVTPRYLRNGTLVKRDARSFRLPWPADPKEHDDASPVRPPRP